MAGLTSITSGAGRILKGTGRTSLGILSKFKISFLFIFIIVIFIQAVILSVEERDFEPGLRLIGDKTLTPMNTINEMSLDAIERESLIIDTGKWYKNFWEYLKEYYVLFEAIIIVYFWIKLFSKIWLGIGMDTSKGPISYVMGFITFILLQMIFVSYYVEGAEIMDTLLTFSNLFKSIPVLFQPIFNAVENLGG